MNSKTIQTMVQESLARYQYELPPPGGTVGTPWSSEQVSDYAKKLKEALVEAYLQRFELREIYDQATQSEPSFAEYWVVAASGNSLEWYDPCSGEFGLGQRQEGSIVPSSIGVRGDLVGVFWAM
jgi:hypothetical protein